jgi:hypothetical protein
MDIVGDTLKMKGKINLKKPDRTFWIIEHHEIKDIRNEKDDKSKTLK